MNYEAPSEHQQSPISQVAPEHHIPAAWDALGIEVGLDAYAAAGGRNPAILRFRRLFGLVVFFALAAIVAVIIIANIVYSTPPGAPQQTPTPQSSVVYP